MDGWMDGWMAGAGCPLIDRISRVPYSSPVPFAGLCRGSEDAICNRLQRTRSTNHTRRREKDGGACRDGWIAELCTS